MKLILKEIESILGHTFFQSSYLILALTHSSASKENNERLEFVGDALLNLIIGEYLFKTFPHAQEGQLSRMRASLVKGEALADLADYLGLSSAAIVGPGENLINGKYRKSILAGMMEALIGAIYMDAGFSVCSHCVLLWYGPMLKEINLSQAHIDAKTQLQEMMQSKHWPLPIYTLLYQNADVNQSFFDVECRLPTLNLATQARGQNKKQAEQYAAQLMIEKLNNET